MFKIGDKVRCIGDTPGVFGRIISVYGNSVTVHWNDGMIFKLFTNMLVRVD